MDFFLELLVFIPELKGGWAVNFESPFAQQSLQRSCDFKSCQEWLVKKRDTASFLVGGIS